MYHWIFHPLFLKIERGIFNMASKKNSYSKCIPPLFPASGIESYNMASQPVRPDRSSYMAWSSRPPSPPRPGDWSGRCAFPPSTGIWRPHSRIDCTYLLLGHAALFKGTVNLNAFNLRRFPVQKLTPHRGSHCGISWQLDCDLEAFFHLAIGMNQKKETLREKFMTQSFQVKHC